MFAYCLNNSVVNEDSSGSIPMQCKIYSEGGGTASVTPKSTSKTPNSGIGVAYTIGSVLAMADGSIPIGDVAGLIVIVTATVLFSTSNTVQIPAETPGIDLSEVKIKLGDVAGSYGTFKCKEAADAMQKYLQKKGLHGSVITLTFPDANYGYVISLSKNETISENGVHRGIEFNGIVYCNVHPYGLPKQQWINDFMAVGHKSIIEVPF